jgi:hypothetical protein
VARGRRPPGRCDKRFEWAYLFAAVEPATGADVALVLPEATTATMGLFLAEFAAGLPQDVHAVLVLDRAGWHGARRSRPAQRHPGAAAALLAGAQPGRAGLAAPARALPLAAGLRRLPAIVDACCEAWNRLVAEPGRLRSLCDQPWIKNVSS